MSDAEGRLDLREFHRGRKAFMRRRQHQAAAAMVEIAHLQLLQQEREESGTADPQMETHG